MYWEWFGNASKWKKWGSHNAWGRWILRDTFVWSYEDIDEQVESKQIKILEAQEGSSSKGCSSIPPFHDNCNNGMQPHLHVYEEGHL